MALYDDREPVGIHPASLARLLFLVLTEVDAISVSAIDRKAIFNGLIALDEDSDVLADPNKLTDLF